MRILHIFDHSIPLHSGYTFRSLAILREQRKLGFETLHLTGPKQGNVKDNKHQETVDGFHFYRSHTHNTLFAKLPILNQWDIVSSLKKHLHSILSHEKIDVIHAHSPSLNGIAAIWAGKKFNLPVVYEMRASWEDAAVDHGTSKEGDLRYRISRAMETYVFKRASAITTICEGLKSDILCRGIDESMVTVIPNAVSLEHFTFNEPADEALKKDLDLQEQIILGFIGSFYGYEGLSLLIDALPKILEKNPGIKLLLVGGGFQADNLTAQVKQLNLEDNVLFTGRVPHAYVHKYYSLVDIFIYPRIPIRLTELVTPLKPMEAMAQGSLVVASNVGGHKELIQHGKTGFLFQAGSSSSLAQTVNELISDQDRWSEIKNAARQFVETQRNWPVSVARYQEVYKKAIENA